MHACLLHVRQPAPTQTLPRKDCRLKTITVTVMAERRCRLSTAAPLPLSRCGLLGYALSIAVYPANGPTVGDVGVLLFNRRLSAGSCFWRQYCHDRHIAAACRSPLSRPQAAYRGKIPSWRSGLSLSVLLPLPPPPLLLLLMLSLSHSLRKRFCNCL